MAAPSVSNANGPKTGAPVPISEVKGNARENRTAAHSHIKGLGLSNGMANPSGGGFIGQAAAREVRCVFCFFKMAISGFAFGSANLFGVCLDG